MLSAKKTSSTCSPAPPFQLRLTSLGSQLVYRRCAAVLSVIVRISILTVPSSESEHMIPVESRVRISHLYRRRRRPFLSLSGNRALFIFGVNGGGSIKRCSRRFVSLCRSGQRCEGGVPASAVRLLPDLLSLILTVMNPVSLCAELSYNSLNALVDTHISSPLLLCKPQIFL